MKFRRRWLVRALLALLAVCLFSSVLLVTALSSWRSPSTDVLVSSFDGGHLLCLLVPFRDRHDELQQFAPYMHRFLGLQRIAYRLVVINQMDGYRFNRAALINVGAVEAARVGCDYVCMHDVDLLPLNAALSYAFPAGGAVHLASPEYHPRQAVRRCRSSRRPFSYSYSKYLGGILLISLDDLRKVNGLSNEYWGWGLEDDEFFVRLREAKLNVSRPSNLSTNRTNTLAHLHDKRVRPRDTARVGDQRAASHRRDRLSGLDTLKYQLLNRSNVAVGNANVLMVDVALHCNLKSTPWCEPIEKATQQRQ